MKNFIIILFMTVLTLNLSACKDKPRYLDPQKVEQYDYKNNIRDLAKYHGDLFSLSYDRKKYFYYYLAYVFMGDWELYLDPACSKTIDQNHVEYDLIYFEPQFKKDLKSYCSYTTQKLIEAGDKYVKKSPQRLDYYDVIAMHFYYNAHRKALSMLIDDKGDTDKLEKQAQDAYQKFINIRQQLPKSYIGLAIYTPFDPNAVEYY